MTTAKQARNSHFQRGSGMFTCRSCGRGTRSTGNGDNEHVRLCEECYDLAGEDNHLSDNGGKFYSGADEIRRLFNVLRGHGKNPEALFPETAAALAKLEAPAVEEITEASVLHAALTAFAKTTVGRERAIAESLAVRAEQLLE